MTKKFAKETEIENNTLSKKEIKILDARWADYIKHPNKVEKWSDVKAELIKKYSR